MSSLEILAYPNPFLRTKAQIVNIFDESLQNLVEQMYTTMHTSEGVGLAATQVGKDMNLFVLSSYAFMSEEEKKVALQTGDMGEDLVIINPQVMAESEEKVADYEGCLSFPEVYIKVKRPIWVKIKAQNVKGEFFELEGSNFGARAILHEMDHLKGTVMTDHLSYISRTKALNKHKSIQKSIRAKKEQEAEESATPLAEAPTRSQATTTANKVKSKSQKTTSSKSKNAKKSKKNRTKKKK